MARKSENITTRHARSCRSHDGARCNCEPTYQAAVWSKRDKKRIWRTFESLEGAKAWRVDALQAQRGGSLRARKAPTLDEAADEFLEKAASGAIRNRKGEPYKPGVIRAYRGVLANRLREPLGRYRLTDIQQADLILLVEGWLADGLDPSTIRNAIIPLRAIYRRAVKLGQVMMNPTTGLDLPRVESARERIAAPDEARALLAALADAERPYFATAYYAGLRRAELLALDWNAVDFAEGRIRVVASWDLQAGPIAPKSERGKRSVPLPSALRSELLRHRMRQGRGGEGLVFGTGRMKPLPDGREVERPISSSTAQRRADKAWGALGLQRIGPHELRHSYASMLIDAGVNIKAISSYMGHASVMITLDRYGHLMPDHEADMGQRLDTYLAASASAVEVGAT
jgi:integrase